MAPTLRTLCLIPLVCGVGCSSSAESRSPAHVTLAEGSIAVAGTEQIAPETVARIAAGQGLPPAMAVERAVSDGLLATHARNHGLSSAAIERAERRARVRALLEEIRQRAHAMGPPTDEELEREKARFWWRYDRPKSARTAHVVVLTAGSEVDRAKSAAQELAEKLRGITTAEEFVRAANEHKAGDLKFKAEVLDPVTPDGRLIDLGRPPRPGQKDRRLLEGYAEAANAIARVGEQSEPVQTSYGFHIILLTERIEAARSTLSELRVALQADIFAQRAALMKGSIVKQGRENAAIQALPEASALMQTLAASE